MKIFKTIILGTMFLFGLTAMSNTVVTKKTSSEENVSITIEEQIAPCSTIYTICDYAQPTDHNAFVACMTRNGC